jgi:predicted ribosomally synthesized peptide with SipW-like signal peptide
MLRATRFAPAILAASAFGAAASVSAPALAEPPNAKATPVYVLSIWTDDSDDQADALTQSLRSRVRQAQGWSLLETPQSFETLAIALKCPARPDPPCLQRIGDQLHADHYVWGTMSKKRGASGEISADLHLWSRGKGDAEAADTYSDNLKDASDESLRGIAARLFGKMIGTGSVGTFVVHAGSGGGAVLVDGVEKAALEGGLARVDLPAGTHALAVRVPGFDAAGQSVAAPMGGEQDLTFTLTPTPQPPVDSGPKTAFPVRKVLGYSAIIAGAGLLVAGGVETVAWFNDNSTSNDDRNHVPAPGQNGGVLDVCANEVNSYAVDACKRSKDAVTVSTLGWVFGGVGAALVGTGVWLLTTDHGSAEAQRDTTARAPVAPKPSFDVLPLVGTRGGSVDLRMKF